MLRGFEKVSRQARGMAFALGCALATVIGCGAPGPLDVDLEDHGGGGTASPANGSSGAKGTDANGGGANAPGTGTPNAPSKPVTTDLYHKTFGDPKGQPVIYLHGGPGGNSAMFEESVATTLAKHGMFAVAYDQRGSGRSPKGIAADFTFKRVTQDLDDLIHALDLKSPIFIGHSWGGTLAVKYMDLHPGIAKGTVLVGNPVDYPESLFNIHERCADYYRSKLFGGDDDLAEINRVHASMFPNGLVAPFHFAGPDVAATMKAATDCNLYFPSLTTAFGAVTTWAKMMSTSPNRDLLMGVEPSVGEAYQTNEHLVELEFNALFQKLQPDLYGIYGDRDGLFSTKQIAQIQSIVTPAHFTLVPGASHIVFIDNEDVFVETFSKYVAELRAH